MITGNRILPSSVRNNNKIRTIPAWNKGYFTNDDIITHLKALTADSNQQDAAITFGAVPAGVDKWTGGVLAPNGCIYGIPFTSTTILKIDTANDAVTTFGNLVGATKWHGGVLAPNGCIYGIPRVTTNILKILSPRSLNPNLVLSRIFNKY